MSAVPEGVDISTLQQNGTEILVVSPTDDPSGLERASLREIVRGAMRTQGGVLLRGFDGIGSAGLQRFAASFGKPLLDYEFGSTPRSRVDDKVFSSTEYPADQWIDQHNEQSYTTRWPGSIFFGCEVPAQDRGATPIADGREVYRRLDPALRRRFADKGVMYVRTYGNGLDLPWQDVFNTEQPAEVERFCRDNEIGFEWLDDGEVLRTRQVCQSEWRHPQTGKTVWFNQAHLFHVSGLPASVREALLEVVDEEFLPRNACFGDGEPIPAGMLDEVRAAYQDQMLRFSWKAGDILALDNVLMSHGREPFSGPRRVVVAMAG